MRLGPDDILERRHSKRGLKPRDELPECPALKEPGEGFRNPIQAVNNFLVESDVAVANQRADFLDELAPVTGELRLPETFYRQSLRQYMTQKMRQSV